MSGKLFVFLLCGAWAAAAQAPDFARDIQPILKTSCGACHSGEKAMGALRLDSRTAALRVITPGDSAGSRLMHRVLGLNSEPRMPMGGKLADGDIAKLRAWIDAGASWPDELSAKDTTISKHWAYRKPVRPAVPEVKDSAWARNAIDRFVLARLEKEGLKPSPEAAPETLLRRVYLDLIGLPPSPEEVDAFLADKRPDAYQRVVERLLDMPQYGERWARPWLDLARYADTNGFEKDNRRSIWKYRDWVIGALNHDLPFDQFTIEQIAGDLLPKPSTEQLIATGFHRNTMWNEEGGVDKEETHWVNLVDRVNTTATVWLGSTIGCAQCHNHKYDPFTQKEYYRLLAFFNNSDMDVAPHGTTTKYVEAVLDLPTPQQAKLRANLKSEISGLEKLLKTQTPELDTEQARWERDVLAAEDDWMVLEPKRLISSGGATLREQAGGAVLASGKNPSSDIYAIESRLPAGDITGIRIEALPHPSLPRGGPGRDPYGNFFLSEFQAEIDGEPVALEEDPVVDDGRIKEKKFMQLWTVDASREDTRLPRQMIFATEEPSGKKGARIRIHITQTSEFGGQGVGHFRLSVTTSDKPETVAKIPAKLRHLLRIEASSRTPEQSKDLASYYRGIAPRLEDARERLEALEDELDELGIVTTLVMKDRKGVEHPTAVIRERGQFMSPGEPVKAGVPAALHPLQEGEKPNRLGLARWLVSPDNPLTARVTVNRIWEVYFGQGIVETSGDFGTQGSPPSHPGLLDWLATEFVEQGWSMKAMHRLIVMSATYRQASAITPELQERDPYNKLLARGPRFRVEAETIRDITLAASGLLSKKIGGPSVFPYQPEGIWDIPYSDDEWELSEGEDRYRRGIYTFLRRTAPYPSMLTFDATSREFCTERRIRTNTPLQALTTLNDPAFFEGAQAMAKRVLAEGGTDTRSRIQYAFRLCTSRRPKPGELDRIAKWYESEKAAQGSAEAAWTMLSNVLLNLDETLTKE
jgi:hypothetical protein